MSTKHLFLGKQISGPFTIPSGIITTNAKIIEKIACEIPEIGVITTKSIGLEEKLGNREPIITQYAPGCFSNAVGLTNPGANEFARQLAEIKPKLPVDKFLLVSIFGANASEFVKVAKILEPYADGFELNLSCPHAKGYGMAIGQDPIMVKEIVMAVKSAVKIPIIPKLTPNTDKIMEIAKAAMDAGADAICAINTIGPECYTHEGLPILSNKKGGVSGKGVLATGLKCVKEISQATKASVPIIGCGGISSAKDAEDYKKAGASVFGVGSALAGMDSEEMADYFATLAKDIEKGTNNATGLLKKVDMSFTKYKVVENQKLADDSAILTFDKAINIKPGQFVFAWIPDVGEKPFSVLDNTPLKMFVQKKGCFSEKLIQLQKGAEVYFRGPYGKELKVAKDKKVILVGGGCGIAALYELAKNLGTKDTEVFFGARDKQHLFYLNELSKCSTTHVSTNDGSQGHKGLVTEILKKRLDELSPTEQKKLVFYNCGPPVMINAVLSIEEKYVATENIFCAIDYVTKCGIGICGSCATKSGKRLCVDGPFIDEKGDE